MGRTYLDSVCLGFRSFGSLNFGAKAPKEAFGLCFETNLAGQSLGVFSSRQKVRQVGQVQDFASDYFSLDLWGFSAAGEGHCCCKSFPSFVFAGGWWMKLWAHFRQIGSFLNSNRTFFFLLSVLQLEN